MRKVLLLLGGFFAVASIGLIVLLTMAGLPLGWSAVMNAECRDLDGLVKDAGRKARLDKAYAALQASGQANKLSVDGLNTVQDKYLKVTEDRTVTDGEADELAELIERTSAP